MARGKQRQPRKRRPRPVWNAAERTLYFGAVVVKRFRRPACNQQLIVAAFEEEGWPERIDDPLPGSGNVNRRRRLHDAIKKLNQCHENDRIRFHGDGTGEGIRWARVDKNTSVPRSSPHRPQRGS